MVNINRKLVFALLLGIFLFYENASGQDVGSNESCGGNRVALDFIWQSFAENPTMPVIIIARLGTKEKSTRYNRQRLKEAKGYLIRRAGMPEDSVITAQGERIKAQGRVEFYFGGILKFYITLKPRQYLNLLKGGHCDYG